ncbi:MAG TPA: hypothetical protein VK540_26735 [Polyangiaceae bacterium]|nr:hypothetical protein [Polyangiaceae bacterium]
MATALGSSTGADLTVGTKIRTALHAIGTKYDLRFDASINTVKGAWLAATQVVHDAADHGAQYAESLVGSVGPALTFDPYSNGLILARLVKIIEKTESKAVGQILLAHGAALSDAYRSSPSTAAYFDPVTHTYPPPDIDVLIFRDASRARSAGDSAALAALALKARISLGQLNDALDGTRRTVVISPDVRSLELDLLSALAEANAWLALIAY